MISAIVLTKDEEDHIDDCLRSLSFCDEIIVVDDNSIDRTIEIAKKYNAVVIEKPLIDFSNQRNFALEKAKNKWVLFVDADEIVSEDLANEIKHKISLNDSDGFLIKREDIFLGKKMKGGDLGNVWLLRLGKKVEGEWVGKVHEEWIIKGKVSRMDNSLVHNSHKNLATFIRKINQYSSLRAMELNTAKVNPSFLEIILYPKLKFIHLYVLKFGFVDGLHGFLHALFMSFYSFLVRGKLYQINKNAK